MSGLLARVVRLSSLAIGFFDQLPFALNDFEILGHSNFKI
jgi:hypothetical protein